MNSADEEVVNNKNYLSKLRGLRLIQTVEPDQVYDLSDDLKEAEYDLSH